MHASELAPMSDREFRGFRDLVYRESGIHMSDSRRELLIARLSRRVRTLGMLRFGQYLALVESEPHERVEMLDRIVTNETRFFREPKQFEFLESHIIPQWHAEAEKRLRPRRVRVWSAGCSTGQEPYSIAMTLLAHLEGWDVEVLATDLSGRALRQAMAGVWPAEKASEIPEKYLKAYMLRGVRSQEGRMTASHEARAVIRFQRLNLHEELPELGAFDLVFCRNVLIYFDVASRTRAVTRVLSRLAPSGYLFLGHSESLLSSGLRLRPMAPSVYTRTAR
ncbi:MAG TPA: protein-glutamate O-methyltransferase CheR [Thermoanaerobaculia bacterium]|jgi:chemotaxis protein methyltransferase CheR|nr:protein-glutamate O-methyltransferase CheR [Thermoanaerobaculia bacterium]